MFKSKVEVSNVDNKPNESTLPAGKLAINLPLIIVSTPAATSCVTDVPEITIPLFKTESVTVLSSALEPETK